MTDAPAEGPVSVTWEMGLARALPLAGALLALVLLAVYLGLRLPGRPALLEARWRRSQERLAGLLSYRGYVADVREWPFDSSTFVRFALYLMIPLGSWFGGAVVERLLGTMID